MNKKESGTTANKVGHLSEIKASLYLRFKGYHIIEKNFKPKAKTGAGEIDLIGIKSQTLVFFEVKYRSSNVAYSITPTVQQRRIRGAEFFLQTHPQYTNYEMRFDVLFFSPDSILPEHIENAFQT